jgi:hypothetical protein
MEEQASNNSYCVEKAFNQRLFSKVTFDPGHATLWSDMLLSRAENNPSCQQRP